MEDARFKKSDFSLINLEFDKILLHLSKYAVSPMGKERVSSLYPSTDADEVKKHLKITTEAKELILIQNDFPLAGLEDIRQILKKLSKLGSYPEAEELIKIRKCLICFKNIKDYILNAEVTVVHLKNLANKIELLPKIEKKIEDTIDEKGEIKDQASPQLSRIRKNIKSLKVNIQKKLDKLISSPELANILRDTYTTFRNGRYVIPVNVDHLGKVKGIVHERSSSGMTAFVEPEEIIDDGNRLVEEYSLEQEEMIRILKEIGDLIREKLDTIQRDLSIATEMDLAQAKALFSIAQEMNEPAIINEYRLNLVQARHPLLLLTKPKSEVVPIDIHLGDKFNILVITGPNTGGKTVCLKTVGLLCLMAQAGMHIPADSGSALPVFEHILADIGDEQNIEQSLSTFSSHITKIKEILDRAGMKSLVLLDELGAGTDPEEGSALGIALLERLYSQGALVMATTHHDALKAFAYENDYAENASVEFSTKTLKPLYKLRIGIPGESNAFVIAENLGIPKAVIEMARSIKTNKSSAVQQIVEKLQEKNIYLEQLIKSNEEEARKLKEVEKELKEKTDKLADSSKLIIEDAKKKAQDIIEEATFTAKKLLNSLNLAKNRREGDLIYRELKEKKMKYKILKEDDKPLKEDFMVGDEVMLKEFHRTGKIISFDKNKNLAIVESNELKFKIPLDKMEKLKKIELKVKKETYFKMDGDTIREEKISPSLNLVGLRAEEAIKRLENYLDKALLSNYQKVVIIHGIGSGRLREAIHQYLDNCPFKISYRIGDLDEGGAGVTIVKFA